MWGGCDSVGSGLEPGEGFIAAARVPCLERGRRLARTGDFGQADSRFNRGVPLRDSHPGRVAETSMAVLFGRTACTHGWLDLWIGAHPRVFCGRETILLHVF